MKIIPATVGPLAENAYLLVDEKSQRAVFVDPGDEGERLVRVVQDAGVVLEGIWLTHAHFDHVGGIGALRRAFGDVPIHVHPLDRPLYDSAALSASRWQFHDFDQPPPPDHALAEGDVLRIGDAAFSVMHVPGHAPGHVLFVGDTDIFGGDLIFAGSIGRTDLPLADPNAMRQSLERASTLSPALNLHPGHGPSTTMARELSTNPFLTGLARPLASR